MNNPSEPVRAFLSFDGKDSRGKSELMEALSTLRKWQISLDVSEYLEEKNTGNWEEHARRRIAESSIFIILLSSSWTGSEGCEFEFKEAFPRMAKDQTRLIQGEIIIFPINYRSVMIPKELKNVVFVPGGTPIKHRQNRDSAYKEVAEHLEAVVRRIVASASLDSIKVLQQRPGYALPSRSRAFPMINPAKVLLSVDPPIPSTFDGRATIELNAHYDTLLGLDDSWKVASVELRTERKRVEIGLLYEGAEVLCPECRKRCEIIGYSTESTWSYLNCMHFETILRAQTPLCNCDSCGVKTIEVPWATSPGLS